MAEQNMEQLKVEMKASFDHMIDCFREARDAIDTPCIWRPKSMASTATVYAAKRWIPAIGAENRQWTDRRLHNT